MLLLPPHLTLQEAPDTLRIFRQTLAKELKEAEVQRRLIVDGSALQRFDSCALAVLLECRRQAQARGWSFAVRHLPAKLSDLARLYGVQSLLPAAAD